MLKSTHTNALLIVKQSAKIDFRLIALCTFDTAFSIYIFSRVSIRFVGSPFLRKRIFISQWNKLIIHLFLCIYGA